MEGWAGTTADAAKENAWKRKRPEPEDDKLCFVLTKEQYYPAVNEN